MSWSEWIHVKKTRKNHLCHGCQEVIREGSKAVYYKGVFEGDFGTCHYCIDCYDFIHSKSSDYFLFGIGPGDVKEAREEEER